MLESEPKHTDELKAINQKILSDGEVLPAVKLKDGSRVQTGTVLSLTLFDRRELELK